MALNKLAAGSVNARRDPWREASEHEDFDNYLTRYDVEDCEALGRDHKWGDVQVSRFSGNLHRECANCRCVSLDIDDEEEGDE